MATVAKKGASEARAAMTELIAELDRTRKEYAKTTLQLTHLETTVQHQRDSDSRKDQVIAQLEADLQRRDESYRQDLLLMQDEMKAKESAAEHRSKFLELEVQRLMQEVEVAKVFEKENRQMRDSILENQSTIEKLQLVIQDLRARAKEETKEHSAQLEAEFRRRINDSEKKFRAEAYRALSDEAKIALQGNDHLQTVLQRQNDAIESVLLKCKQLEQSHATLTTEQEIAAQNLQHHMGEIQRLKKQLGDANAKNTQLEDALQQRKVERASLELLFIEYETTRKQLAKVTEQARRAARDVERWRNRAIQLTQELGGDQRAIAEAKNEATMAHGEKLEAHLHRSKVRAERRDRERVRNAEGAAAYRSAAGIADDGQMSAVDDDYGDELGIDDAGAIEDHAVNATDILRMWNVNFGSDVPPAPTTSSAAAAVPALTDGASAAGEDSPDRSSAVAPSSLPLLAAAAPGDRAAAAQQSALQVGVIRPSRPADVAIARGRGGVDDRREELDKRLSVLAQPKLRQLPAPARHYAVPAARSTSGSVLAPDLRVVSHGEFATISIRGVAPEARFITP